MKLSPATGQHTPHPSTHPSHVEARGLIVVLGDELAARTASAFEGREGVEVAAADDAMDIAGLAGDRPALVVADAADLAPRELVHLLGEAAPKARAAVVDRTADVRRGTDAFLAGCLDYLDARDVADPATLRRRLSAALGKARESARVDRRLTRLRSAVRRLNSARREVGQRVDVLCNDLVGAYGELSRKVDALKQRQEAIDLFESADDLEQLLCHLMDYLLRRLGHCNIAVFLDGDEGLELGAYMKYTTPGDKPLTDALAGNLAPLTQRRGVLSVEPDAAAELLTDGESPLRGQEVFGVDCTYLAESLATVVCFRDGRAPFDEADREQVAAVAPSFAAALAAIVRGDGWDEDEWAAEEDDDGDDWWKQSDRAI